PPAEVNEVTAKPALQHPVGRDRRVDAAGEEHERPPARPDRQAGAAAQLLGEDEDLVPVDLDEDLEVRRVEVDSESELVLDGSTRERRQLVRAHREALVPAARADREGAARPAAQELDGGGDAGLGAPFDEDGRVDERRAEHIECAPDKLVAVGLGGDDGERPAAWAQLEVAEPAELAAHVSLELLVEATPVPAAQHHLAVLEEHAGLHP